MKCLLCPKDCAVFWDVERGRERRSLLSLWLLTASQNRLGDSANCMTLANYLIPRCLIILTCNIGKVIIPNAQLEPDMEQQIGSKLGKNIKAVCCHPAY